MAMKRLLQSAVFKRAHFIGKEQVRLCKYHDLNLYPNVRALEYCITCGITLCYMCGNSHVETNCAVDCNVLFCKLVGGYDIFEHLKDNDTEKADLFNQGYPAILDLTKLKCPCGKPFMSGTEPTICAACGSATCSPYCHNHYLQSVGKCVFVKNFTERNVGGEYGIQGLRGIRLENILRMQKSGAAKYSQCSTVSPRFIFGALGPTKDTLYLQRGFRIYGSPCPETLEAMEIQLTEDDIEDYELFDHRLCLCNCEFCSRRAPHSVFNCVFGCTGDSKYKREVIKSLRLDQECGCGCTECRAWPKHTKKECMHRCHLSKFNKSRPYRPVWRRWIFKRAKPQYFI